MSEYPTMSMALNKDHLIRLHREEIVRLRKQLEEAKREQWEPVAVMYEDGSLLSKADCGDNFEICCKTQTPLYATPQPAPDVSALLEALHEGRRAIGDHYVPDDCYATGPVTGDSFRDLVQCPACSFIAMYDEAITKVTGATND